MRQILLALPVKIPFFARMRFSRLSYFILAGLIVLATSAFAASRTAKKKAASKEETSPVAAFRSAIVVDAATGKTLFEDNADAVSAPASMTKLMTFAVINDKLRDGTITLATPVIVEAADTKMGGTQVWLKEKEEFPVEELIYAMMIQSANDTAYALGRTVGGSVSAFVDLMNAKARELGMTRTTFRTPHGLPPSSRRSSDGDLSSPRDFAILCRYLLANTDILKYTSVKTRPFGAGKRAQPVVMSNHNHLLGAVSGVDGLKTGFTNSAGFCVCVTAQRQGRRIIVVVMDSPDRKTRDIKAAELLNRGFAALPPMTPVIVGNGNPPPSGAPVPPAPPSGASPVVRAQPGAAPVQAVPAGTAGESEIRIVVPGAKK